MAASDSAGAGAWLAEGVARGGAVSSRGNLVHDLICKGTDKRPLSAHPADERHGCVLINIIFKNNDGGEGLSH